MNDQSNLERDPQAEAHIRSLQWHNYYFGPRGAVALAERYYSKFGEADPQTRLWARMSLTSDYYYADGSAMAMFTYIKTRSKFNVYGMIKWVWVSYSLLKKAWVHAQTANFIMYQDKDLKVSSSDLDMIQSVARKYYRTLLWDKPHGYTAKVVLGLATHSIEEALKMPDCTDMSKCLLLIGRVDLLWLQVESHNQGKLRIAMFDTLLEVWDIAMKIALNENDQQTKRQLSQVFRQIKDMSKKLIPFHKEVILPQHGLYPSSAKEMMDQANQLLIQYLGMSASLDQGLKAGMKLCLPSQSAPPPHQTST